MNPTFFAGPPDIRALESFDCVLVNSLHDVERFQDPDWPGAVIVFPMNWVDIIGDSTIPFLQVTDGHSREEKIRFYDRADAAFRSCETQLRNRAIAGLGQYHGEELVTMVYDLIQQFAACGRSGEPLSEKLWYIIQHGAYPCGWCGDEDGQIVAYAPSALEAGA